MWGAGRPSALGEAGPPRRGLQAVLVITALPGAAHKPERPPEDSNWRQSLETGSHEEKLREPRGLTWRRYAGNQGGQGSFQYLKCAGAQERSEPCCVQPQREERSQGVQTAGVEGQLERRKRFMMRDTPRGCRRLVTQEVFVHRPEAYLSRSATEFLKGGLCCLNH